MNADQGVVHVKYLQGDPSGTERVLREEDMTLVVPFPTEPGAHRFLPAYAAVNDFQRDPLLNATSLLRIEVTPVTPGLEFWTFVSITNNNTQHVTLVTP